MFYIIIGLLALFILGIVAFIYFSFRLDAEASKLMGPLAADSRERKKL
jgi:hypothetical protein